MKLMEVVKLASCEYNSALSSFTIYGAKIGLGAELGIELGIELATKPLTREALYKLGLATVATQK